MKARLFTVVIGTLTVVLFFHFGSAYADQGGGVVFTDGEWHANKHRQKFCLPLSAQWFLCGVIQ